MTNFSIITFFDPYGDMKSNRKQLSRKNYQSQKPLSEVKEIVEQYNDGMYYNGVEVASFDNRLKTITDFDSSYYTRCKAHPARYQSIPGF